MEIPIAGVDIDMDGDELALKNKQEDIMHQKIHEHKQQYVQRVNEIIT